MPQNAAEIKDFFISYTGSDRAWAEWIAWQLDSSGYKVVLQAWDFAAGTNFISQMKAAADSKRTIAVYSSAYFKSKFSEDEWTAAFAKRALIPVRIEACELPDFLRPLVYIDLVGMPETAAREALLKGVSQTGGRPASAPAFPAAQPAAPKRFPAEPPRIFEVPLPRNRNFTGRDRMLEDLHQKLTSGRPAAIVQSISGMGGVGKTSLALEYSYRFATDYNLLWWLRAEQPSSLANDYAGLAQKLELPERNALNQPEIIAAVRNWLSNNSGWLLVFDNAVDVATIAPYQPRSATGNILITSRNPVWAGIAAPLPVQELAREESVRFLLQRTNRGDEKAADRLSEVLGDLPLALAQAASYIEAKDISITDYIARLASHSKKLLEPIKGTWALSVEKLRAESPLGLNLLTLSAFLAPDNIPRPLLRVKAVDDLDFDDAIASLRRYGLIETTETSIGVHRLLQQVIREDLEPAQQRAWAEQALKLVKAQFPEQPDDYRVWPACAPLFPHAMEAIRHAEDLQVGLGEVAALLNAAGVFEGKRGQLQNGRDLLTRSLELEEKVSGPNDPKVAIRANNLGDVLTDLGQIDLAIPKLEQALRIDEAARGPNHPFVAIRLSNLGRALLRTGDVTSSLAYANRALSIDEKALGPDDHRVALDYDLIGTILYERDAKGDLEEAAAKIIRAIEIDSKGLGENHSGVAAYWSDLGNVLAVQGKLIESYTCFRRALAIYHATLPAEHPYIRIAAHNASDLLPVLRSAAVREQAALKPGDPNAAHIQSFIAELDAFAASLR